eukprot:5299900-Pleurochrysis_carterae.AAC.4
MQLVRSTQLCLYKPAGWARSYAERFCRWLSITPFQEEPHMPCTVAACKIPVAKGRHRPVLRAA